MKLLEFVLKSEMSRNINVGSMVIERNWLFTRGITNDEEIQEEFDELIKNNIDWTFRKEIFDADNTRLRIFWKRKESPRIHDKIQAALHRGEIFDVVDIV